MSSAERVNDSASERTPAVANCRTEADLLAREMAAAELAMRAALAQVPGDLVAALDFRALTRRYPWQSVGLAAGLGFATGNLVLAGRKRPSACDAPAAHVQFSMGPSAGPNAGLAASTAATNAPSTGVFVILSQLLGALVRFAMPLVVQWLQASSRPRSTES